MELMFGDLIDKAHIDKKRVHMIRHALSNKICSICKENNWMDIYTMLQSKKFAEIGDYIFVFESGSGTTAVFCKCYIIKGKTEVTNFEFPKGYPDDIDSEKSLIYNIEECEEFNQYNGRIIIDWGKGTIQWHIRKSDLPIIEMLKEQQRNIESFTSYENFILTYEKLNEIVLMPSLYSDWVNALSLVNAIYVITDTENGKLYVGSSYGNDGLLGRWTEYAKTKHGGNKKLEELLKKYPQQYKKFQYSILQLLPKNITSEMAVDAENKWKEKLCTREHGYNDN